MTHARPRPRPAPPTVAAGRADAATAGVPRPRWVRRSPGPSPAAPSTAGQRAARWSATTSRASTSSRCAWPCPAAGVASRAGGGHRHDHGPHCSTRARPATRPRSSPSCSSARGSRSARVAERVGSARRHGRAPRATSATPLALMSEAVREPAFPENEVSPAPQHPAGRDRPRARACPASGRRSRFLETYFDEAERASRPSAGTRESVGAITREELVDVPRRPGGAVGQHHRRGRRPDRRGRARRGRAGPRRAGRR